MARKNNKRVSIERKVSLGFKWNRDMDVYAFMRANYLDYEEAQPIFDSIEDRYRDLKHEKGYEDRK